MRPRGAQTHIIAALIEVSTSFPEPECAVGNRELGTGRKPPSSQIEEHFLPGLRTLADTVGESDEFLFVFRRRTDNDQ